MVHNQLVDAGDEGEGHQREEKEIFFSAEAMGCYPSLDVLSVKIADLRVQCDTSVVPRSYLSTGDKQGTVS